ncbi:MAG: MnhB domain-containing protein [Candidatus Bipolaricaulota bacterium]
MRVFSAFAVLGLVAVLALGTLGLFPRGPVGDWEGPAVAYGARNAVAAIVLGARLWDTLMEVLVYAMAMLGVRMGMSTLPEMRASQPPVAETPLLLKAADILIGVVLVFSLYLAASGHLGPGGGFPAGAILGSGLLLLALAKGADRLAEELYEPTLEGLEYGAVAVLIAIGAATLLLGARGAIPLVGANLVIGLEVAIGAWVVLHRFATHRGEV